MKEKIGFGLFLEIATLVFIIFMARSQGVSKEEYWSNFSVRTETVELHYHIIAYASFLINGVEVKDWLEDAETSDLIKDDIQRMLDSMTLRKIGGEAFYKGAKDTLVAQTDDLQLESLTELFHPILIFDDTLKTYRKDFPITIERYHPATKMRIDPLLKAKDKPHYFESGWIDDLHDGNLKNLEELSGFTDLSRLEDYINVTKPILQEHENTFELTWRKGAEDYHSGKNYLGGGITLYRINSTQGEEVYYADHLFDGLEWTKDKYGEEILDERFNIWYHSWVFWVFAIAISISIIRRFLVLKSIED